MWVHHRPVGLKPLGTNGKGRVAGRGGGYGGLFEDIELELLKDDFGQGVGDFMVKLWKALLMFNDLMSFEVSS